MKDYKLQGNPVVETPIVGNLIYDELGQAVVRKVNEQFKGIQRIEYSQKFKKNQTITHSNTPRALAINQILNELGVNAHVLSPEEVVQYWDAIPERGTTYADTNGIVVFPNEGPNEILKHRVLRIVGRNSIEDPLVVSELGVERVDSLECGFTFTETGNILVREAPYLKQDGRVSYNSEKGELESSEEGVKIWTPSNQSGLRRLYRSGVGGLVARFDDLLVAGGDGRVQLVQDPQGLVEKISEIQLSLKRNKDARIAEINERHEKAQKYLKTGQL